MKKRLLVCLFMLCTVAYGQMDTDAIAREICIEQEGYQEGFYGGNSVVVCRASVEGEDFVPKDVALDGESFSLDQQFRKKNYSFSLNGSELDSFSADGEEYESYLLDINGDTDNKTVVDNTLIDHDPEINYVDKGTAIILSKNDHKMTFTPLANQEGSVPASGFVENDTKIKIEYYDGSVKETRQKIADVSLFLQDSYTSNSAEVNLSEKGHDLDHDDIVNYSSEEKVVIVVPVNGEERTWVGLVSRTSRPQAYFELDLKRVTALDEDGNYILEDKVSAAVKLNQITIELYHFVDGVKTLLVANDS